MSENNVAVKARNPPGGLAQAYWSGERKFWGIVTIVMAAIAVIGFSRSFFLRPFLKTFPSYAAPEPIFFIHGVTCTAWLVVFAWQAAHIRARSLEAHRRLGWATLALAPVVAILGAYITLVAAVRPDGFIGIPLPPRQFLIAPLSDVALFSVFTALGYLSRRQVHSHKRYMFLAGLALIEPAIVRVPMALGIRADGAQVIVIALAIGVLALWDLRSLRRVHPVTAWGGLAMVAIVNLRLLVALSAPWQAFAAWAMALVD